MKTEIRECRRCVMNDRAAEISYDADGNCNYCTELLSKLAAQAPAEHDETRLQRLVEQVRRDGAGKRYDCIVGVSGGADSAYALYLAVQQGLRPLAVHMDNGWNSELAVNNIENLVRKLGVDLHTHVIDWREYRELQQAFFDADVIDIELLYDNAMLAVNYQMANRYGIKYILAGTNSSTEGMRMPPNFAWNKFDRKNILALAARNGIPLRSMPTIGVAGYMVNRVVRGIQWLSFLDYIDYRKQTCMDELVGKIGYRPYPYKHYESVFTRFYQAYLLPKKFGIDKRRLHFSSLICSGQMTREQASELLLLSPYPTQEELEADLAYFLKKMQWKQSDLDDYLKRPARRHDDYPSEAHLYERLHRVYQRLKGKRTAVTVS